MEVCASETGSQTPGNSMQVHTNESNEIVILKMDGEMDIYNCQILREHVKLLFASGRKKVVANLEGVSYIDSSGIGALISACATLKKAGGGMKLCRMPESVTRVFHLTRLTGFFEIYESELEALGAFEA